MKKLSGQRNRELVAEIQKNINELIEDYLYLVESLVDLYVDNYVEAKAVSREEMINVGKMGLIKAATKYQPDSEHKFSTYATWWIRVAIEDRIGVRDTRDADDDKLLNEDSEQGCFAP